MGDHSPPGTLSGGYKFMPLNLRKTFMMRVAIVLMVTLSASCFAADVAIKGHLVDVSCAARKASRPDFLPTHSNSCMQMPSCNRSGFGVFTEDKKFIKFDED